MATLERILVRVIALAPQSDDRRSKTAWHKGCSVAAVTVLAEAGAN